MRCLKDKIDPKVLFMYLSSEMGQYLLRSISSGATIPLIQLARLKELQIVIPTRSGIRTDNSRFRSNGRIAIPERGTHARAKKDR